MSSQHKCLLINNDTRDCQVTLYTYRSWDLICLVSHKSVIIAPGEKHIYRQNSRFKYEISGKCNGTKTTIRSVTMIERDKYVLITELLDVKESDLSCHLPEKRICLRKLNMEEESTCRNHYEMLRLRADDVRGLCTDEQDHVIQRAYHQEVRRWHPDTAVNCGDGELFQKVRSAYEKLMNRESRADHHNELDYDMGWLSCRIWKVIFWPECASSRQRCRYWKRVGMTLLSMLCIAGGAAITASTAGMSAPAAVVLGAIFGGGLIGGGMQTFTQTIRRDTSIEGCSFKKYIQTFALGFVAGLVAGGAAVGFSAAVVGIGNSAVEASSVTLGQYFGVTIPSGAIAGLAYSLASDAQLGLVEGVDVSAGRVIGHAIAGSFIGAVCGAVIGAVESKLQIPAVEDAVTNIGGNISQRIPGAKRLGVSIIKRLTTGLAVTGTASTLEPVVNIVDERFDDSRENRPVTSHFVDASVQLGKGVFIQSGAAITSVIGSHAWNEINVMRSLNVSSDEPVKYGDLSPVKQQQRRQERRFLLDEHNNTNKLQFKICRTNEVRYQPLKEESLARDIARAAPTGRPRRRRSSSGEESLVSNCSIRYISKGVWLSKMIVTYNTTQGMVTREVRGADESINIPMDSTNVEVRFQVMRFPFLWYDVATWDRFQEVWLDGAHIFRYDTPPVLRTFTIGDPLWKEAVKRVTDESWNTVSDMASFDCPIPEDIGRIRYLSKGSWKSKMIVNYTVAGRQQTKTVQGSGGSVSIPAGASSVEVRFKVLRFPFVWCDVKKWTRFDNVWLNGPHIFAYSQPPVQRTFTIGGLLYQEGVIRVTNEAYDEVHDM